MADIAQHAVKVDPTDFIVQLGWLDALPFVALLGHTFIFTIQGQLDPEKVHAGFEKLSRQPGWQAITARLRSTPDGRKELHIPQRCDREGRPACAFYVDRSHAEQSITSVPDLCPHPSGSAPQFFPDLSEEVLDLVRAPGNSTLEEQLPAGDHDKPVFQVQLVCFKDATVMGLSFPHAFTDATGIGELLASWGEIMRGEPVRPVLQGDIILSNAKAFSQKASASEREPRQTLVPAGVDDIANHEAWLQKEAAYGRERRRVWIPDSYVAQVRSQAKAGGYAGFLSDNDIVFAYAIRIQAASVPKGADFKVYVAQAVGLRQHLRHLYPDTHTFLYNAISLSGAPEPRSNEFYRTSSLAHLAQLNRSYAEADMGPAATLAYLARFIELGEAAPQTGRFPFPYLPKKFDPSPEQEGDIWYRYSSWVKCGLTKVDWSAAAVDRQPAGAGIFRRLDNFSTHDVGREFCAGLCREEPGDWLAPGNDSSAKEGGYWLQVTARAGTWDQIVDELKHI